MCRPRVQLISEERSVDSREIPAPKRSVRWLLGAGNAASDKSRWPPAVTAAAARRRERLILLYATVAVSALHSRVSCPPHAGVSLKVILLLARSLRVTEDAN